MVDVLERIDEAIVEADPVSEGRCMDRLNRLSWVGRRDYEVSGSRFAIRSTSDRFVAWLDRNLGGYAIDEDTQLAYSVVLAGRDESGAARGFHLLYRGTVRIARTRSLVTLARTLVAELNAI